MLLGGLAISNDNAIDESAIPIENHDNIADGDGMPFLSLSVDGLTNYSEARGGRLDLHPESLAANDDSGVTYDALVSGAVAEASDTGRSQASVWSRIKGYFGI